jgi:plasmid stabilization system protein ParE
VAAVVLTPTALQDLDRLIRTLSLPPTTTSRLKASLRPLETFPELGAPLHGRWSRFRFVLGPWRWMIVVYTVDDVRDTIAVVTIQDARSARAATSESS